MKCDFKTFEDDLNNYVTAGAYHVESGLRRYPEWTRRMIRDFGDGIKPNLEKIWQGVQDKFSANLRNERYSKDAQQIIAETFQNISFEKIEQQRRGMRSWEVTEQAALKEGKIVAAAMSGKIRSGTTFNAEQLQAMANKANQLAETGKTQGEAFLNTPEYKQFENLLNTLSGGSAEAGRALNILGKNVDPLLAQAYQNLSGIIKDPKIKAQLEGKLPKDPGFWDKVAEWATNIKLASASSNIKSMVGGATTTILKTPQRAMSAGYNRILSYMTGVKQDRFGEEVAPEFFSTWSNVKQASDEAWKVIKGDEKALKESTFFKREFGGRIGAIGTSRGSTEAQKRAGNIIRTPARIVGAVDTFWRTMNANGIAKVEAVRQAKREGLTNERFLRRVDELFKDIVSDNPSALAKKLRETEVIPGAEYLSFQAELGKFGQAVNMLRERFPQTRLVVPFFSTWVNLWKFGIRHSPLGVFTPTFVNSVGKAFGYEGVTGNLGWKKGKPFLKRMSEEGKQLGALTDEMAAMTTGTAFMAMTGLALSQIMEGGITGSGPSDKGEFERLYATGWRPYSLRFGDTFVSFRGFEPVSSWLTQMANANEGYQEEGAVGLFDALNEDLIRNFVDNPFLAGVSEMMDALRGENKAERFLGGLALGITVPTIIQQTAKLVDPTIRDQPRDDAGLLVRSGRETLKRIPFASQTLPARLTAFGEEETTDFPAGRLAAISVSKRKTGLFRDELDRLKIKIGQPGGFYRGEKLTEDQRRQLVIESGQQLQQALELLVQSPGYGQLDDEQRTRAIRYVRNGVTDAVSDTLFGMAETLPKQRGPRPETEIGKSVLKGVR